MINDLQRWLALEHEAVWLYGLIGGRFDDLRGVATEAWGHHRVTRDRLAAIVKAAGHIPAAPAMGYGQPVRSERQARTAARDVERRIAQTCATVAADEAHRRLAVARLRQAARAEITWGGKPQAFPGLD